MRRKRKAPVFDLVWTSPSGYGVGVPEHFHDLAARLSTVRAGIPEHHTPKSIRMTAEMSRTVRLAVGAVDVLLGLPVYEDASVPEGCVDVVMRDGVTRHRVHVANA